MHRRYDPRCAKAHLTYDASEIAALLGIGAPTVHDWRKFEGLRPIDDRRPYLYAGEELARFLKAKNKPRRSLLPGHFYCAPCKAHREPEGHRARVTPKAATAVTLIAECPTCTRAMRRPVRISELQEKAGMLDLRYEDGTAPLGDDGDAPRTDISEENE